VTQPFAPGGPAAANPFPAAPGGNPFSPFPGPPVPPGPEAVPEQPEPESLLDEVNARTGATSSDDPEGEAIAAEDAETEWLRQQHGGVETALSQFARGALDALLSPGALAGAYYETLGTATNAKVLKDFGRDLGRASSGKSAAEALGAVFGGASAMAKDAGALVGIGEGATEQERAGALDAASRERRALEEQEKARPLLTTISRIAGASAASIGVGAAATAHSGTVATIAALGAEGAGTGAQAAYEQAAPLRDVLASAAIGGIIGAGVGGVAEGAQRVVKKAPDLAKVFGDKMQDVADQSAWKAVVDRDPQAMKDWMRWSPDRRARVVDRIRDSGILGKGDDVMLATLEQNADDAGRTLATIAQQLDEAGVKPSVGNLREGLAKQTAELRASGSGTLAKLADTIDDEVRPFMQRLAAPQTDEAGNVVGTAFRDPTFTELRTFKQALGAAKSKHMRAQSLQADELRDLYGNVARQLDNAADSAGPEVGKAWRNANEAATDFITLKDALQNQMARKLKNRFISPSDYGTSISAGLATAVLSGNPFAGAAAALGTALIHKGVREGGRAIAAKLSSRFAKMSTRVSRAAAGGPEAQEVLELIKRSRMLVDETVERAGANPTVRQAAEETARNVAAREIQKRAGEFNAAEWHKRPVTPVQKLVYRSQILDTAADDLARTAKEVEALHPVIPDQLDIRRIEKLTKDAQGPEALAMLQGRVRALAESTPPTVVGDAGAALLRKLSIDLDRAGIAEAMAHAHQAAGLLQNASKNATDEVSQNFAERAALALRDALGVEQFGSAGREYRALVSRPSDVLKDLSSAEKVREALRVGDHQGGLRKALTSAQAQIAAAHDAAFKLAGAARPAELGKALTNADRLFHAAELATTIDGKGLHKMFDVAGHVGVHEGIPHEAPPMSVAEAVEPGLEKVATAIRHEVAAKAGKVTKDTYTPPYLRAGTAAGAAASWPALLEEKRDVYDRRLKQLEALATRTDIPRNYQGALAGDVDGKLTQLLTDMPKPQPSLKGKAFESMSEGDLDKANAMWEATTAPLTVFDDLASGALDYEKVSYVWKQYPGLQQAAQAGVMDVLISDLDEDERSGVPDSMLTQLDYAFGFKGTLQDTVEHGFSTRMSAMYVPPPQPGSPKGSMETPGAEPTFAQRIANG
jgi:hypothetical protein